MKIFISHSSKNKFYGDKLVDLLRNTGVKENEIIYTSNTAYGIPVSENIFNWLKLQITEKPFVIYLLSEEYYQSVACLNEMGAAWIVENKHAAIFTPNFDLSSEKFKNGALDPREIGFYISDEERVLSFLNLLSNDFEISKSHIIISQSIKKFITAVNSHKTHIINTTTRDLVVKQEEITDKRELLQTEQSIKISKNQTDLFSKFENLIVSQKLKDEELILLYYIIETGRFKLMTGWQENNEIDNIKEWEKINEISNKASSNYSSIINRFALRGFTEVSAVTSSNNPKEYRIKEEISTNLLDLPESLTFLIMKTVEKNYFQYNDESTTMNNELPW